MLGAQFADFVKEVAVELAGVQAIDKFAQFWIGLLRFLFELLIFWVHTLPTETVPLN